MPTRRTTLKTIAAGTVVGSLSGCVQLATQRTVEYKGTPAIVQSETRGGLAGTASNDGYLSTAVGVEAHSTVERFGITKEIVAHSWGMVYASTDVGLVSESDPQVGSLGVVGTFTTPSIQIAGRELNPIAELTVGEIGGEFASINVENPDGQSGSLSSMTVDDATGKKVLRAFRDAVGSPGAEYEPPSLDASTSGGTLSTVPDWDGEVHEFNISIPDEEAEPISDVLRFDKHDGDFVVVFGAGGDGSAPVLESISTAELVQKTAPWTVRPDPPQASDPTIIHPTDDQFSLDQLELHLLDTNLRGMQGLVEQSRNLIDETQNLLTEARNDTRDEEDDRFSVISNTQDDLKRLDTVMGGLAEGLLSISTKTVTTDENGDWSANIERAQTATEIATRAHERVASHNDTRNEEDDRFVQIERTLDGLMRVSRTIQRTLANGRKTVKARDV